MSETKDGGPAYPVRIGSQHDQYLASTGMSLRDAFAIAALQGMLSAHDDGKLHSRNAAANAYAFADAMLKAREAPHGK